MQSRMDKYSVGTKKIGSRTEKNKALYESVKNSSMKNYEIKSNFSVIDEDADNIDVRNVQKFLSEKYDSNAPKRKSIDIPNFDEPITDETIQDTKEYDINAIIAKAKLGKNVDYNKERLKKIREAQFEIINNLDLEIKKVEEPQKSRYQEEAENNLINLINTITELETKNKNKDIQTDLDLLSDLADDSDLEVTEPNKVDELEEVQKNVDLIEEKEENVLQVDEKVVERDNATDEHDKKVEETLSKLDINVSSYDEFADISKRDSGSLILKIIIFIIIIMLVLGAIYILNYLLDLGLF